MKIENTVKIMKEIHSDRAIIVKVGQFTTAMEKMLLCFHINMYQKIK